MPVDSSFKKYMGVQSQFNAASRRIGTLANFNPTEQSISEDLDQLDTIRNRCRDETRNNPLAEGILSILETAVVGTGLRPRAILDGKALGLSEARTDALEREIEEYFDRWASSFETDFQKQFNFYELQRLVYRSALEGGDSFVVPVGDGEKISLSCVEAERVCNPGRDPNSPKMLNGVELYADGRIKGYWVLNTIASMFDEWMIDRKNWQFVRAFTSEGKKRVFRVSRPRRLNELRGFPILTPMLESFHLLNAYFEGELSAQEIASRVAFFLKGDLSAYETAGFSGSLSQQLGWPKASIFQLQPEDELVPFVSQRAQAWNSAFTEMVVHLMGICVGIPYEILWKHFTASFSASRAAILEFDKTVKQHRAYYVAQMVQPVYELVVRNGFLTGKIGKDLLIRPDLEHLLFGCAWIGPPLNQIDDNKAIQAAIKRVELGVSTREMESMAISGIPWEANKKQIEKERAFFDPESEPKAKPKTKTKKEEKDADL